MGRRSLPEVWREIPGGERELNRNWGGTDLGRQPQATQAAAPGRQNYSFGHKGPDERDPNGSHWSPERRRRGPDKPVGYCRALDHDKSVESTFQ